MPDLKITQLGEDTSPTLDDLLTTVNNPGGTPVNKKVTISNFKLLINKNILSAQTNDYIALPTDDVIICNKTTDMVITLPLSIGTGKRYDIKNINTGMVTVSGNSIDKIDGESTQLLSKWDSISLIDYASNEWIII